MVNTVEPQGGPGASRSHPGAFPEARRRLPETPRDSRRPGGLPEPPGASASRSLQASWSLPGSLQQPDIHFRRGDILGVGRLPRKPKFSEVPRTFLEASWRLPEASRSLPGACRSLLEASRARGASRSLPEPWAPGASQRPLGAFPGAPSNLISISDAGAFFHV